LFEEYPPSGRRANQPQRISRNDAMNTVDDQGNQPCDQRISLLMLTTMIELFVLLNKKALI